MRRLTVREERWPLHEPFVISRMRQDEAEVALVEIEEDGTIGRGECDACLDGFMTGPVLPAIERVRPAIEAGAGRQDLLSLLPAGPARNALDCALWDLKAKRRGQSVWALAGLPAPGPVTTVFTIGLGTADAMAKAAAANADRPVLKLKLGRPTGDVDRVAAVRAAAPNARLSVDANTGWSRDQLLEAMPHLRDLGVEMIEQPFPPGSDATLDGIESLIPIAADESCTDESSLPALLGRYDLVNVKLDKTGGLTGALRLIAKAEAAGLGLMIGCNLGTSLAMAPAMLLAGKARLVDLDGPLLLTRDRTPGLRYAGSTIAPPDPALWG